MVVGVKLNGKGKIYHFDSNDFRLNMGDKVIVDTENGLQYGIV